MREMDGNRARVPLSRPHRASGRKRVLVVNCYFDELRRPVRRRTKIPQAMGPAYLAGAFSRELCEVRLYSELYSGPLEDAELLAWPDLLVLTGLTTSLDRMRHVTAYARTRNKRVVAAAGGPAIRAFPRYCSRLFDYCCLGDVEQLGEVIAEVFGPAYVAEEMTPRFDLAHWIGRLAHVESSRYCNFHCSFCTLTAEGRGYQKYELEELRRHITAAGKKDFLLFIDNNFYGKDRGYFLARLELIRELWRAGYFRGWVALVTNDFFLRDENLVLARKSGCWALFSGVESFNTEWLRKMNKLQNTCLPQVEMIRKCLEAGILFLYGLVLDVGSRRLAELRQELEFITGSPDITLPSYISIPIPLPATPFFYECLGAGRIFPMTKVRDLDSTTLCVEPLDSLEDVLGFLRGLQTLKGYRRRVLAHAAKFWVTYRSNLMAEQMQAALTNAGLLCAAELVTGVGGRAWLRGRSWRRTHVSTTEKLDSVYQPAFGVDSRYADYFRPTLLTDESGQLAEEIAADLLPVRSSGSNELGPSSYLVQLSAPPRGSAGETHKTQ